MNSCLYECSVMHHRLEPVRHRFAYKLFLFYLDLDEIDGLSERMYLLSRNRFNLFTFRDRDHWPLSGGHPKERLLSFLKANGVDGSVLSIRLLTHAAVFGYAFNPVSFYFCFDRDERPVCAVAEVGNTFGEQKLFYFGPEDFQGGAFLARATKYFYVSPFIDMDADFEFDLAIPREDMMIRINDLRDGRTFFLSSLIGKRKSLNDRTLFWYSIRFPLITLMVIFRIHWQALRLFLKKLPYHKKEHFQELQREVLYGKHA